MSASLAKARADWTDEQARAIETRDISVALSAGAGCGKTFVLTERFLDYFRPERTLGLAPSDVGRLVAITFTERAAREMRQRIRKKCREELLAAPAEHAAHWADLLRELDGARISTIHSFCASLLRSRAVEAGLDPRFEVLEQAQSETLLWEAVDDELRALLAKRDESALDAAARFGLRSLQAMLRGLVLECGEEEMTRWLALSPPEQVARWKTYHRSTVLPAIVRAVVESPEFQEIRELLDEHEPVHPVMQARVRVLRETLRALPERKHGREIAADLAAINENARVQGGGLAKGWRDSSVYESFKRAAEALRGLAQGYQPIAAFDPERAMDAAACGLRILAMANGAGARYAARKVQLGVLDFNDLLRRTHRLLADPNHADLTARLGSQIELLLVDEFQDTDPLQVGLVEALCGNELIRGKLFFVGDYKQSIYRFRGADPQVFRGLRLRTPERGRQSLTKNFRSQPAILQFVNALFWQDLGPDYEPLRAVRPQRSPTPAVEFLWATGDPTGAQPRGAQRHREAEWIARRIRGILDDQQPIVFEAPADPGEQGRLRPARPGDFAILFRALSDVEHYEAALRRHGIDYYLVGGHAFYAQQEIYDLVNLLRALASTSDTLSLVGALRSGFFALADETIFWLSQHPQGLSAGLAARAYPSEIPPDQQRRARFAAQTLAELRERKDRLSVSRLIDDALERTGYDAALLNEFLGERKLANLRKLVEQARGFERGGFGLPDFIAQLSEFVARQPDEPLAAMHSEDTDVVRLMSVHQSKGLEFPIVIVPDLGRPQRGPSENFHFDSKLGPLVKLPKGPAGPPPTAGYDLWRVVEKMEDAAEANRLLYVATTRAADQLILSAGTSHNGEPSGPWMHLLARRFDLATGRLVGPLPAGEAVPQIRVTTEEPPAKSTSRRAKVVDLGKLLDELTSLDASDAAVVATVDPVAPDPGARRHFSFSRLTGGLERRQETAEPASDESNASFDPRALGSLVHAVLAVIDYGKPVDCQKLVQLHAARRLTGPAADVEEATVMIERFLASSRAAELAQASESHAELEFLLAWPPDSLNPSPMVISGYLDRLYRDSAGHWHVLDFKTNRLARDGLAQQAAAYEMQMLLYGLATERILGVAPRSLVLHFLRGGQEHAFAWNDAARRRAIAQVDQAIAANLALAGST